ncbi:MAG: hypothetical protein QOD92_1043 [Acidimicrobiaceae bacterium]|jgi:hypothetical protein
MTRAEANAQRDVLLAEARTHVDALEEIRVSLLEVRANTPDAVDIATPLRASALARIIEEDGLCFA